MPRYFLHIRRHEDLIRDPEGAEFPNLEAALEEARNSLADMAAECLRERVAVKDETIEVADASDRVIGKISCYDVIFSLLQPTDQLH